MVIERLKAVTTALAEALKDKGLSETSRKHLEESNKSLQALLVKAREAAKEEGYEEESGEMPSEEHGGIDPHKIKPGHKMKKTVTVEHTGNEEEEESGDEPDPKDMKDGGKDEDEENSSPNEKDEHKESRRVHLELLLKEAGIPKEICTADELAKVSLKEAKAAIEKNKKLIEVAKKAVGGNTMDFVPAGAGSLEESTGGETLNSLFSGCAE